MYKNVTNLKDVDVTLLRNNFRGISKGLNDFSCIVLLVLISYFARFILSHTSTLRVVLSLQWLQCTLFGRVLRFCLFYKRAVKR